MFQNDYLTGIIDRMYKTSDGTWSVVDYKTDNVSAGHLQSRARVYKPQLALYAYLVHKWSGQNDVTATLLLLRHPDTPVHFIFGRKDFQEFEREAESCIKKIKQNDFSRTMDICDSCTYQKNHKCLISGGRLLK
jgi:ATP-dependent helicase/DNAse subunit B